MSGRKSHSRGLTARVLRNISDEDLRYSIAQYARQNKDFKDFLHLRFLHLLPDNEPYLKYRHFLSGFLRKYLDQPEKINKRSSLVIYRAFEELRQQARDLTAVKNYIESSGIFLNLLLYNSLIIEKTSPETPAELESFQKSLMHSFSTMLEMNLPRPLLLEIEDNLRSLLLSGSIFILDARFNALDLLLKRADSDERRLALLSEYSAYLLNKPPKSAIIHSSWLGLLHQTLLYEFVELTGELIGHEVLRGKVIYQLIFEYINEGNSEFAETLIDASLKHYGSKLLHYFLEARLFLRLSEGNNYEAIDCMQQIVSAPHQDYKTLKKLLRRLPDEKREIFKVLADQLKTVESITVPALKVYATFLSWMGKPDETFDLITNHGNVWVMIEFSSSLQEEKKSDLMSYFIGYLTGYLKTHIGKMSVEHIQKILFGLRENGAYALAEELDYAIRSDFKHRKSLVKCP